MEPYINHMYVVSNYLNIYRIYNLTVVCISCLEIVMFYGKKLNITVTAKLNLTDYYEMMIAFGDTHTLASGDTYPRNNDTTHIIYIIRSQLSFVGEQSSDRAPVDDVKDGAPLQPVCNHRRHATLHSVRSRLHLGLHSAPAHV